jgi:AhpD family alkylhydroperoxidase
MFLLEETNQLFDLFGEKVYDPKYLDKKTIQLLAVACSVMADCVPCIESHYKQAVAAGASSEEISEALAVSMAISAGSKRAKYKAVVSNLERLA